MSERSTDEERELSIDRETVREWADEYDVVPVRETDGGTDRLRMVPEAEIGGTHERLDWEAFFDEFEEEDYVAIRHGREAVEPLEVTKRNEAVTRSNMDAEEFERRLMEGETVTSEIMETTVVESVVVEETTVESELVDTDIVEERVLDAELVGRECTACEFPDGTADRESFDADRYLARVGGTTADPGEAGSTLDAGTVPASAEMDVEDTWLVTRELVERFTVESRITDTEVTEADTIEDHDVDVQGLHRSIVEGGIIDVEHSPDEVLTHYDIETEIAEDDRIRSFFDRERTVEDEIVERKRLRADVTGGELLGMETLSTRGVDTGETGAEPAAEPVSGTVGLTDAEEGKTVVDAGGEAVGTVTRVDESKDVMYVDPHHSITERIMSALGWGDADEDEYPLRAEHIERTTDDRVELKGREQLTRRD